MRQYGLIGFPLSHSFSKGYFSNKFSLEQILDSSYDNFPIDNIDKFPKLIQNANVFGLNVTIPYKEQVIPYLDELEPEARAIGAINTIQIKGGKTKGFNTDIYGFVNSLLPFLPKDKFIKALILGTGGASKAIAFGLKKLDIPYQFVSRSEKNNCITYTELSAEQVESHQLIINTTPLGMYPKVEDCPPIAYGAISNEHILYDLVYNPEETLFLRRGKKQGAQIKNGLEMLHLQAEKSWEIWNS